jgi:hypothetical protein
MVHKPKHKVHSFRGLLADGNQEEINLERSNANLAYRIVKFDLMGNTPGADSQESIVKIYREEQSSVDGVVNFNETDLLGVAIWMNKSSVDFPVSHQVIFDNTLFSRNIYVTSADVDSTNACNYYIEIEEVPVGAATLMQLKLGVARKLNLSQ